MQMTDKNRLQFGEMHMSMTEHRLCPFRTVNHHELTTYLNDLTRGIVLKCRQSTATT